MPLQVLVADDIAASRGQACDLVVSLGHVAHPVGSGAATLERVAIGGIDLVLLDLLMPDMDGFEVTRRLRRHQTLRWLPVIVTSALQGDDHFVLALEQGADDCLARPLHAPLLGAKLRHYERVLALQAGLGLAAARHQATIPAAGAWAQARVVLANPQAQGDADAFVASLRRAAGGRPLA